MTQRYRFTLIRDTPVTINYSESVRIYPGLFFFFGKIYLFEIFNDLSSLNYPKFKFSLSRFSQFPNASLSHRDFKFFGFFSVEFLEKSFDLHVFETFNISPLFFFNIKLFENKFLPNSRISNIKLSSNSPRFFFFLPLVGRNFSLCRRFPFSRKESRRIEAPFESPMRIFSGIARLWSSLEKSLCRKDGRLGKEHDRGGEEKGRRAFACRVARLAEVQWPRVAPATVLFRRFSRKKNPALRFRTKSENGFLPQRLSRGFSILSLVHLLSLSLFLG